MFATLSAPDSTGETNITQPYQRDKNVYASIAAYMKFFRNPLVLSARTMSDLGL